jgi:hypothetical protein
MSEARLPSFPTIYRGIRFRSRLEARWAAFFDCAGWRYDYEPCDLGAWSPDFLLHGKDDPILCEVKPIDRFDEVIANKMVIAADASSFRGELLLLGLSPFPTIVSDFDNDTWLGWLNDGAGYWNADAFDTIQYVRAENDQLDFAHNTQSFHGRMFGDHDGDHHLDSKMEAVARKMWAAACNIVQWCPR